MPASQRRPWWCCPGAWVLACTAAWFAPAAAQTTPASDDAVFAALIDRAHQRFDQPYADPTARSPLPPALSELDYDGYRDIRCPPEHFVWHGETLPFRVEFRHRGGLFDEKVRLATANPADPSGDPVTPLPFTAEHFTYGEVARAQLDPEALPADLGYAGLALHRIDPATVGTQPETAEREFLSIQGGCYFRGIGDGMPWGSSVRAVAINTALPDAQPPEEFPRWVEFWVARPQPDDDHVTVYGLLDGPSVVGAYRLRATPGAALTVDVVGRLWFRRPVAKLGLAPITSMFLFGEERPARFGDYRPEVHDADGLLLHHADGRVDWRPLRNPQRLAVTRFPMTNPRGFGLVQRDRDFANYQDLETLMQQRPSVWVTPGDGFGDGWVELVEVPSDAEGMDNINAFWVPDPASLLPPGEALTIAYRVAFTDQPRPTDAAMIRFADTRTAPLDGAAARFLLDTAPGSALPNPTFVKPHVAVGRGRLIGEPVIQYNPFSHAYRVFFDVQAEGGGPVELRAVLRDAEGEPISETWLYRWDGP